MADINHVLDDMTGRIGRMEKQAKKRVGDDGGGQWISMGHYVQNMPVTAAGDTPFMLAIPKKCTLRRFVIGIDVAGTNNGSNYWTIQLSAGGGVGVFMTINTSAIAGSTWVSMSTDTFTTTEFSTSNVYWHMSFLKTGLPASMYLATPSLYII